MKQLMALVLLFATAGAKAQQPVVTATDVYAFFTDYFSTIESKRSLVLKDSLTICTPTAKPLFELKYDTVFSDTDRVFINQQLTNPVVQTFAAGAVKHTRVAKSKTLKRIFSGNKKWFGWKAFRRRYHACLHTCSLPVFSVDKQWCIVSIGYACAPTIGEGFTAIFKFSNGHWQVYRIGIQWVS